jgi:hypothetical protein
MSEGKGILSIPLSADTLSTSVDVSHKRAKQDGARMITRVFEKLADDREGENDSVEFTMTFYKIKQLVEVVVDFIELFEDLGEHTEFLFNIIKRML